MPDMNTLDVPTSFLILRADPAMSGIPLLERGGYLRYAGAFTDYVTLP
jgi:hypothetical protein